MQFVSEQFVSSYGPPMAINHGHWKACNMQFSQMLSSLEPLLTRIILILAGRHLLLDLGHQSSIWLLLRLLARVAHGLLSFHCHESLLLLLSQLLLELGIGGPWLHVLHVRTLGHAWAYLGIVGTPRPHGILGSLYLICHHNSTKNKMNLTYMFLVKGYKRLAQYLWISRIQTIIHNFTPHPPKEMAFIFHVVVWILIRANLFQKCYFVSHFSIYVQTCSKNVILSHTFLYTQLQMCI